MIKWDAPTDQRMFTEGACYMLAMEIGARTGWPIYTFWTIDGHDLHAFVKTPQGTFLDIEGEHDRKSLCERWECKHIRKVRNPKHEFSQWTFHEEFEFFKGAEERAREVAPNVIVDYFLARIEDK